MIPPGGDLNAEVTKAYRDHVAAVHRSALRAAFGDGGAAKDATQEAFLAAYENWPSVREMTPGRQRSWLSRTACNKIIDSWRRTSAEYPAEILPELADSRTSEDVPAAIDVAAFWKEIVTVVPRRAAQVAYLAWNEGWNNAEIGRHLGIDRATVLRDLRLVVAAALHSGRSTSITVGNEGGEA